MVVLATGLLFSLGYWHTVRFFPPPLVFCSFRNKFWKSAYVMTFKFRPKALMIMLCRLADLCHLSVASTSPLLEVDCALDRSLCAGSGLKLWPSSSESGGHWWAGWGAASSGRHVNKTLLRKVFISRIFYLYYAHISWFFRFPFAGLKVTLPGRAVMSVLFKRTPLRSNKQEDGPHTSDACELCNLDSWKN